MKWLKSLWEALEGHKTHIGVALYFLIGGAMYLGLISEKEAVELGFWVTAWTGYALHDAVRRLE